MNLNTNFKNKTFRNFSSHFRHFSWATLLITIAMTLSACSSKENPQVTLQTNHGEIVIELFAQQAPETVKNFTYHIEEGNLDDTIFHRVIPNFMIQGGDFENRNGTGGYSYKGPGTKFSDEFHKDLSNVTGTLSMANSGPNTNGSQFFINVADNTFLDNKHSVFGKVIEGLDNVIAISQVSTAPNDKPSDDVVIEKANAKE
jgi:cyclophilin family peptidyl-prolyl cis-trans isomerase